MGFLRTYLALCVVAAHSSDFLPWPRHDAREAVEIFFLISGFYMALVLSGRYQTKREFYVSRWLRIFGPYYAVLLCIIAWSTFSGLVFHDWLTLAPYANRQYTANGPAGFGFATFTNLSIFGQDWVMFLSDRAGEGLRLTAKLAGDDAALYHYLVIPQGWSIGIEETFYVLAPFIVMLRSRVLLAALLCSVGMRLYVYHLGFGESLWKYRLGAFEIALFLAGVLAFRAYARFDLKRYLPVCTPRFYPLALVLLAAGFALHATLVQALGSRIGSDDAVLLSYAGWAIVVPVLFAIFRDNAIDRFIGDLCYPIYLIHFTVALSLKGHPSWGALTAGVTVALAILLYVVALRPYEAWRHAYVQRLRARRTVPQATFA